MDEKDSKNRSMKLRYLSKRVLEEEAKKKFQLVKTSFQVSSLGFAGGINN